MPDQTLHDSWHALMGYNTALGDAVAEQDWERACELAAQRHRALLQHFQQHPVGPATAEFYQQALPGFMADEPRLNELAVQARREIMKQSLALRQGRRAVSAYQV